MTIPPKTPSEVQAALNNLFGRDRIVHPTEESLQEDLDKRLELAGINYIREYRLGPKKRPDFLVSDIAIEIKTKGSPSSILRQLKRYADDPSISGVILVTTKLVDLPETLSGKPLLSVQLWKNLL